VTWFVGTWLHLAGASLWFLRGTLALLGLMAAGLFLWWYYRVFHRSDGIEIESGSDDMDPLIADALNRLRNAKQVISVRNLPQLFVLGPTGSTKSTMIVNSGLEPELLAGQVYQDNTIVPTGSVNLWYTRETLIAEAAGGLIDQPSRWIRLICKLQPSKLFGSLWRGRQAPRAAVVCFDCEAFLKPGASQTIPAAARSINARLQEMSQQLGINLPVYVLFTRTDRVAFFEDYVRNLSGDEVSNVLGATLPMRPIQTGIYADDESKRLTKEFDALFYSLAGKRMDVLARECDIQSLSRIYEFPREWRKLRTLLVQFLVDLGRPTQLQANPFVRGFYFTGVRAIIVDDAAPAAAVGEESAPDEDYGCATRILSHEQIRAAVATAAAPARATTQRKVPQWVFLKQFFNEVVLADRDAMGASGVSTKVSFARRMLIVAAGLICCLSILCCVVSFIRNLSLQSDATAAARQVQMLQVTPGQAPSMEDLKRLESLRQVVETLDQYRIDGAPWSMRWGLYSGNALYPDVRKIYFARFQQMILGDTRQAVWAHLQNLPSTPGPNDNYGVTYNALKAYLITTANHDKSTRVFLAPVLMDKWTAGRNLDSDRFALARIQFEFYADQLAEENPYSSDSDMPTIERARGYLSKFAAVERIYRSMLDEADHKNPSIAFNRLFPGSADAVVDSKEVEGAFTKNGFGFIQDAISHSDRFFAGEEWVLGKQNYGSFDRGSLEQQLRTRYHDDYLQQWRTFVRGAAVIHYSNAGDAARKLNLLSGNNSPLLALIAVVSTNTVVGDNDIAAAFQSAQVVVPANANPYTGSTNQSYMNGLSSLLSAVDQLAKSPGGMNDLNAVGQVRSSVMSALTAAKQVEQGFKVDQSGRIDSAVATLLESPIKGAESILRAPGLDGGSAKAICSQYAQISGKFPFNSQSKTLASVAEVNALFQPNSGAIWIFYEQQLKPLVIKRGSEFVVNPAGGAKISAGFLRFFNHAAQFSETVYPGGSQTPQLRFTLRPYPVAGIQELTFDMNGQTLSASGSPKQFVWTGGDSGEVRVIGSMGGTELGILNYTGPWAIFQFFSEADRWQIAGSGQSAEWVPKSGLNGQPMMIGGKALTLRYDLDMPGAPVFNKAFMNGMKCSIN
jgi:type VI secretion system protein ImpL